MGRPKKKLIQEVEKRRTALFFVMLQRVYEECEAALTSLNTNITPLNSVQFEAISYCLQALSAFNHAIVGLSAEQVVTVSKIIPIVRTLFHKINEKADKLTSTIVMDDNDNLNSTLKVTLYITKSINK